MRSRNGLGKKQGVSESRNCTCVPHASSMRRKRARYFSAVKPALNCLRREGIMMRDRGVSGHDYFVVAGASAFHMSTAHFQEPSGCFFQTTIPLFCSVTSLPPGVAAVTALVADS